jgi:hypothetical protein
MKSVCRGERKREGKSFNLKGKQFLRSDKRTFQTERKCEKMREKERNFLSLSLTSIVADRKPGARPIKLYTAAIFHFS